MTEKSRDARRFFDRPACRCTSSEVFGDPLVNITLAPTASRAAAAACMATKSGSAAAISSMIKGKHSLKVGGQYHHRKFYTNTANPMNGDAIFDGQITGFPMADALLGYPSRDPARRRATPSPTASATLSSAMSRTTGESARI